MHVPAFRADTRCDVVALAASTRDRAERVAARLGVPAAYGGWRELVASPEVDLVSVAVPPGVQPDVVIAAATARKHVLCEKPLAVHLSSAEAMLAAARSAGVKHGVDLELAELPVWHTVRRMIESGVIGRVGSFTLLWHVRTRPRPAGMWKERPDAGGGAAAGFASHLLHLVEWCVGHASRLTANLGPERGRARVEIGLELEGGCCGEISVVTDASPPSGLRAEIRGDRAVLVVRGPADSHVRGHTLHIQDSAGVRALAVADLPRVEGDERIASVAPLVSRLIDAVVHRVEMRPNLADGVRVQHLLDAAMRAANSGGGVNV